MAVPGAVIQIELPELKQVATAQLKTTARHCRPHRLKLPFHGDYAKRCQEDLAGEIWQGALDRAFQDYSQSGGTGRAIAPAPAVGGIFRLGLPVGKTTNRQIECELSPILHQIHALLVSSGKGILVIALEKRAHCQEIFNSDLTLAGVAIPERKLILQVIEHMGVGARDEMPVDRGPDQHAGYCFCRGSRVSQALSAVTIEVALISHSSTPRNENAGELLEIPRFDRLLHLAETLSGYANLSRGDSGQTVTAGGLAYRRSREEEGE